MKGTTRLSIAVIFLAAILSGCAEQADPAHRPSFADGSTLGGSSDATVQSGAGSVSCQVMAASSPVVSGVVFQINVRLTNGTLPYAVVGFVEGVATEWTSINAAINSGSSSTVMVTRKVTVRDAKGITGSCAFAVSVNPS